jgi:hypothetical protein
MSDDVPPDGIVRTALQLLPVPAHGTTFWAELEQRLDAEHGAAAVAPSVAGTPAAAAAVAPADPTTDQLTALGAAVDPDAAAGRADGSLALVPPALRRTSNAVLVAMAAAAAVVVAVAGGTLLSDRQATEEVEAADALASSEIDALLDDQAAAGTIVSLSEADATRTSDAVLSFVGALHDGDATTASAAIGPASREALGSDAALEERLAELDLGAWAAEAPEQVLVTPVLVDGDDVVAIVTLVGSVEVDGELVPRADAIPIRVIDGEVLLEPFVTAGLLELVLPEGLDDDVTDRAPVTGDDELMLVVPEGAAAPVLRLDDGAIVVCGEAPATELIPLEGLPGRRCTYRPDGGIAPGEHTLTVAFVGADGAGISAESVLFEAA